LLGDRHKAAVKGDHHAVLPRGALDLFKFHTEIFGRHDAVAKLLLHEHLDRLGVLADNLVQPPRDGLERHRRRRLGGAALGDDPHPRHIFGR